MGGLGLGGLGINIGGRGAANQYAALDEELNALDAFQPLPGDDLPAPAVQLQVGAGGAYQPVRTREEARVGGGAGAGGGGGDAGDGGVYSLQ
jgi:hypothetical protein